MTLQTGDLLDMVDHIFEIDSFQSKMGKDKDICVLSFNVRENQAAKDLVDFVEKGFNFVLDADATSGEQADGNYKVFVEMQRDRNINENIIELLDGVGKLCAIPDFKFRYYKSFESKDADMFNLSETVPVDPASYDIAIQENAMNNYKNFFDKSFVDRIEMHENIIKIQKKFADSLDLEFVDFGKSNSIHQNISESFNIESWGEILFLTKYLGEYTISKYGDKLLLENKGYTLVVKRK